MTFSAKYVEEIFSAGFATTDNEKNQDATAVRVHGLVRRDADPGKMKKVKKGRGKKTKRRTKKQGLKKKSLKKIQRRNNKRQGRKGRYKKVSASISFFFKKNSYDILYFL